MLGCDPDLIWKVKNGKVSILTDSNYLRENTKGILNPIESLRQIVNLSKISGKMEPKTSLFNRTKLLNISLLAFITLLVGLSSL